jgi:hypothetical protein
VQDSRFNLRYEGALMADFPAMLLTTDGGRSGRFGRKSKLISDKMKAALVGGGAVIIAAIITAAATLAAQSSSSTSPASGPSTTETLPTEPSSPAPTPTEDGGNEMSAPAVPADIWVADLKPIVETGYWGGGTTATVRGKTYVHALQPSLTMTEGTTMSSQFALGGEYSRLTGLVGIADGGHSSGKALFEIVVDNVVVQQVELAIGAEPIAVDLSLVAANDLVLRVTDISQSAFWTDTAFLDFKLNR